MELDRGHIPDTRTQCQLVHTILEAEIQLALLNSKNLLRKERLVKKRDGKRKVQRVHLSTKTLSKETKIKQI